MIGARRFLRRTSIPRYTPAAAVRCCTLCSHLLDNTVGLFASLENGFMHLLINKPSQVG